MNHLNRPLGRRNRHVWLVAYTLLAVGVSVLAAGLRIDGWWLPGMCLLAIRPTHRQVNPGSRDNRRGPIPHITRVHPHVRSDPRDGTCHQHNREITYAERQRRPRLYPLPRPRTAATPPPAAGLRGVP